MKLCCFGPRDVVAGLFRCSEQRNGNFLDLVPSFLPSSQRFSKSRVNVPAHHIEKEFLRKPQHKSSRQNRSLLPNRVAFRRKCRKQERGIICSPSQRPNEVKRSRKGNHALGGNAAVAGFEADDPRSEERR